MLVYETFTSDIEGLTRLDPEYYNPAYRTVIKKVKSTSPKKLSEIFNVQLGPAYSSKKIDVKKGIKIAKIGEVTNKRQIHDWVNLDEAEFKKYGSREIFQDEILLTLTGDPPDVGKTYMPLPYCKKLNEQIAFNQRVAKLRSKNADPYYLYSFMSTEYFRIRFEQVALGIRQRNVSIPDLFNAFIFIPENYVVVNEISEIVRNHFKLAEASFEAYTSANQLLEQSLKLDKVEFEMPKSYVAGFNEIILSHRLDSQHYKPKYQQLLIHLRENFECFRIGNIETYNRRGAQPVYFENGEIDIINSEHVGETHIDYEKLEKTSRKEFGLHPEAHVFKGDLLIYTTGAYIGRTSVYLKDSPALASNHVNILRLKGDIDTGYLALLMNSIVGKFQTEKYQRGSAQAELYPHDISKYIIPIINKDKMIQIGDLVRESLKAKEESKALLEKAKQRVEQLIEEAAAKHD